MSQPSPSLTLTANAWTLSNRKNADGSNWSLAQRIATVKDGGFDAYCGPAESPGLKDLLEKHGLRFGGAFDADATEQFAPRIAAIMEIGDGPINCQLCHHDTPSDEATRLTIDLMEEAERQNAQVHLEVHRDTCTETPEKTTAISEGFKKAKGSYPRVNFDFSHPSVIKHLNASNYSERLFENIPQFQQSTLWHMRPFNGHHCQVPVTDGKGSFSPEYEEMRPFIRQAFDHWLSGPRPGNELWVVPELGPLPEYGLSCFPDIWEDAIALGKDIRQIWAEAIGADA